MGNYQEAFSTYQLAATYNETNIDPLYGMIYCRIRQDKIDDAEDQINLVSEINSGGDKKNALHFFLEAIIKRKKSGSIDTCVKLLDQCLNFHINSTWEHAIGFEFYTKLNADFLMELAKEYLEHSGNKAINKGE